MRLVIDSLYAWMVKLIVNPQKEQSVATIRYPEAIAGLLKSIVHSFPKSIIDITIWRLIQVSHQDDLVRALSYKVPDNRRLKTPVH